ncbi:MAG: biopolymer transporter ExbD [Planctomycetes bacterium]|nr:biopolymer transporter ExbD [Planctomycetota bacterium]
MPRAEEPAPYPALTMTPMIDVVFQLLIFFMLSMNIRPVEGKLLLTLPRGYEPSFSTFLDEIRITVCAGEARDHGADRRAHESRARNDTRCRLIVENVDIAVLEPGNARTHYRAAARRARDMAALSANPRFIIDADGRVPYEHVLGLVNALKELRIESIEFAADPAFPWNR